jgi:hypothetical protein
MLRLQRSKSLVFTEFLTPLRVQRGEGGVASFLRPSLNGVGPHNRIFWRHCQPVLLDCIPKAETKKIELEQMICLLWSPSRQIAPNRGYFVEP